MSIYQSAKNVPQWINTTNMIFFPGGIVLVTAIGISVMDHIMIVNGFSEKEGSYHCENYLLQGGGMAATALCAASKLGCRTKLFSRIGNDLNGEALLKEMDDFGVDTSGVLKVKEGKTTASFVLVDKNTGEKQFFSEKIKTAYKDMIDFNPELLDGTKVLLVDGYWMEAAQKGAKWAKDNGIPVVGDFKHIYPGLDILLNYIDYLVIPSFFAAELTDLTEPEKMLFKLRNSYGCTPIITMGADGGIYLSEGEIFKYKPFPITCIDSTGAGDAFHGVFCYMMSCGLGIHKSIEYASAAGALNCRAIGGRASLPDRRELKDFLSSNGSDITELDEIFHR